MDDENKSSSNLPAKEEEKGQPETLSKNNCDVPCAQENENISTQTNGAEEKSNVDRVSGAVKPVDLGET